VKGGFKAEKLEKKTFHLDTVKNPFAFAADDDSEDEQQDENTENTENNQQKQETTVE